MISMRHMSCIFYDFLVLLVSLGKKAEARPLFVSRGRAFVEPLERKSSSYWSDSVLKATF